MSSFKINSPPEIKEDITESINNLSILPMYNSNSLQSIDVDSNTEAISDGDVLSYDGGSQRWTYKANTGGGGGVGGITVAGDSGSKVINSGETLTIEGAADITTTMGNDGKLDIAVDGNFIRKDENQSTTGNLTANTFIGQLQGQINSNASSQPNITSVGTLQTLRVNGGPIVVDGGDATTIFNAHYDSRNVGIGTNDPATVANLHVRHSSVTGRTEGNAQVMLQSDGNKESTIMFCDQNPFAHGFMLQNDSQNLEFKIIAQDSGGVPSEDSLIVKRNTGKVNIKKGLILPVYANTGQTSSPETGELIYVTDTNELKIYTNQWKTITPT